MHGRPRVKVTGPPDPERVKAAEKKAALFGQLTGEVLARRAARRYDAESLALAGKLLELHPEVYTVWNYRREALGLVLDAGGEAAVAAVNAELALTERALHKNPKSYATWHHRKWIVAKGFCSLEQELKLVGMLLDADERNFHGWGYRRFVVQLMGTPAERELEYARHKINQNFSNYSAWHSRTALLPVLHGGTATDTNADSAAAKALSEALRAAAVVSDGPAGEAEPASEAAAEQLPAEQLGKQQQETQHQQQQQQQQQQHAQQPPSAASGASKQLPIGGTTSLAGPGGTTSSGAAGGTASSAAANTAAAVPKEVLDEEYELVKQAFYTEPEDQSGWFYHRWLLGCSLAHWEQARNTEAEAAERQALLDVLAREQQTCEELLEIEPEAKWPLLTVTRLKELQQQVLASSSSTVLGSGTTIGSGDGNAAAALVPAEGGQGRSVAAEIAEGYARLKELDPLRRGYYQDAKEGRAHVVAKPAVVV